MCAIETSSCFFEIILLHGGKKSQGQRKHWHWRNIVQTAAPLHRICILRDGLYAKKNPGGMVQGAEYGKHPGQNQRKKTYEYAGDGAARAAPFFIMDKSPGPECLAEKRRIESHFFVSENARKKRRRSRRRVTGPYFKYSASSWG